MWNHGPWTPGLDGARLHSATTSGVAAELTTFADAPPPRDDRAPARRRRVGANVARPPRFRRPSCRPKALRRALRREPALPRPCQHPLLGRARRALPRAAAAGRRVPLRPAQGDEAEVGAVLPAPRLWRRARQPHAAVEWRRLPGRRRWRAERSETGARRLRPPASQFCAPPTDRSFPQAARALEFGEMPMGPKGMVKPDDAELADATVDALWEFLAAGERRSRRGGVHRAPPGDVARREPRRRRRRGPRLARVEGVCQMASAPRRLSGGEAAWVVRLCSDVDVSCAVRAVCVSPSA